MQDYEVKVFYRGSITYIVPAASPEAADAAARARYANGEEGVQTGENEERVTDSEVTVFVPG